MLHFLHLKNQFIKNSNKKEIYNRDVRICTIKIVKIKKIKKSKNDWSYIYLCIIKIIVLVKILLSS